jgi:hypothetical protein
MGLTDEHHIPTSRHVYRRKHKMIRLHSIPRALWLNLTLCFAVQSVAFAAHSTPSSAANSPQSWTSSTATHAYGLPGAKAKEKGSLSIDSTRLTFTGKAPAVSLPLPSILAVTTGSERVELWGMKGRLLRMAIPQGGGIAAAAVMHHKVSMLTVEFRDDNDGYHSAVFFLPADEAAAVVQRFATMPAVQRESPAATCAADGGTPGVVRVLVPSTNDPEVPAAYRGLVYEHLIDRLTRSKGIGRVQRDGEVHQPSECPEYTIALSITGFKPGSQVKRAVMGPVGMFVGTTRMTFDLRVARSGAQSEYRTQAAATIRGESESMNVTDAVAKKLLKKFTAAQKDIRVGRPAHFQ